MTGAGGDARLGPRLHRRARADGLGPALTELADAVVPDRLPCGPGGHVVAPAVVFERARYLWAAAVTSPRRPDGEVVVQTYQLAGGAVLVGKAEPGAGAVDEQQLRHWSTGLVWVRLGLSEALRRFCVGYLARRRTGDSYVLQQQMVKAAVAEVAVAHLEVRAVLDDAGVEEYPPGELDRLHALISAADRQQLGLLGGSGYLTDGPGSAAHVSELLADVHSRASGGRW